MCLEIAADRRVGRKHHVMPLQSSLQIVVVQLGRPARMLPVLGG